MAKVLKKHVFRSRSTYPWEEWSDGQVRQLVAGDDFDAGKNKDGLCNQIHQYAKKHNLKARTEKNEAGVVVQFLPKE